MRGWTSPEMREHGAPDLSDRRRGDRGRTAAQARPDLAHADGPELDGREGFSKAHLRDHRAARGASRSSPWCTTSRASPTTAVLMRRRQEDQGAGGGWSFVLSSLTWSGPLLGDGRRGEGHLLPYLRAAVRDGRHGRGREADQAAPRRRPSALQRLRVSEGHRDGGGRQRPRPRAEAAAAHARGRLRGGELGGGAHRHRRPPVRRPRRARQGVGGLVHGQPRRLLLLAHAVGQGLPRRGRARRTTTAPARRT